MTYGIVNVVSFALQNFVVELFVALLDVMQRESLCQQAGLTISVFLKLKVDLSVMVDQVIYFMEFVTNVSL